MTEKKVKPKVKEKPEGYKFGRPTKYKPEFCQQMIDYFSISPYEESKDNQGKSVFKPNKFPTLERFAASHLKVTTVTLHNWATEKDSEGEPVRADFFEVYNMCRAMQSANLQEGAMSGAYQASFAGKAATNILNWRDKQEVDVKADIKTDIKQIQSDMTAEEAARYYQDMLKNDS